MNKPDNYGQCKNHECGRFGELREDGQCLRCNPRLSHFEKRTGDTLQGEIQPLQDLYIDDVLWDVLTKLRNKGASYHQLQKWLDNGENRGITHMDIKRAIAGQMPKSNRKREAMRLSPVVHVPACPVAGCTDPHQHKHGEQVYNSATQIVKPKPKPRRYKDLWDTPVAVLRWQLDNRLEVTEC